MQRMVMKRLTRSTVTNHHAVSGLDNKTIEDAKRITKKMCRPSVSTWRFEPGTNDWPQSCQFRPTHARSQRKFGNGDFNDIVNVLEI